MSTVTVSFDVAERVAGLVAVGQEVAATREALPGRTIKGRIVAIDNRIDPGARTLKVEATLPNDADILKPGMAITVDAHLPRRAAPVGAVARHPVGPQGLVRLEGRRRRGPSRRRSRS